MSQQRIDEALDVARRFGGDDSHHAAWVVDQMVRALTGCPVDDAGTRGESEEYHAFIAQAKAGEDGPDTYEWNPGIAP